LKSYLEEVEYALKVVRASERITMKYFKSRPKVNYKADRSPVTAADKSCERFLVRELSRKFPDHGFYGEEFGEYNQESPFRWIIDPIDGTKNFTRGIPYWGTLCGLEHVGQIVAGVMTLPALKAVYYASRGNGAYLNGKKLKVSRVRELEKSTIVFGRLSYFLDTAYESGFRDVIKSAYHDRGFGDCFGYTFVAAGSAEAMLDPVVSPWDVAAIKIIIEESGGIFTDFEGNSTIYNRTGIAANPYIHEAVLRRMSRL
jgi:histidinol phosphatase-like enzyme (inositol monophosphatase family)